MGIKSIVLAASTFVLSSTVNAAILSVDWQSAGDNLITQDTASGLEWLDLTVTTSRSYNDISSQFGVGGEFEGWRYATSAEVSGFFDAFGGDSTHYNGWSTQNNGLFDAISPLWGDLYCADVGCPNGDGNSWFVTAEITLAGAHNMGLLSDIVLASDSILSDFVDIERQNWLDTDQSVRTGSALVRASVVPIPAAVFLFGSGLIGLIGMARRKA